MIRQNAEFILASEFQEACLQGGTERIICADPNLENRNKGDLGD